jgi:hypothetical protein
MGLFRSQKPKLRAAVGDPLGAIPLKPENVQTKTDSRGVMHLRMTPPLTHLHRKVAKWLGYDYSAKVELDEYGTFFYSLVDGERTLNAIVDAMAQKLSKSRKETAMTVVAFTKSLMTRNLLLLKIPATTPCEDHHE